ncbi:MAG TPA: hypothetical protein VIV12_11655 [Streptosporangiaceae bacterium]
MTSLRHLAELAPFRPAASTPVVVDHADGQAQQPSLWAPPCDTSGR